MGKTIYIPLSLEPMMHTC